MLLCQLCENSDKSYKPTSLENHIKLVHFGENYPTCDQCGKRFTKDSDLERHQNSVHENKSEPVTCEICGESFSNLHKNRSLASHMKNHDKSNLECLECGKSYKTTYNLTAHMKGVLLFY